uniref:Small molecule transporter n=4 Tax=Rhodnius prolixus TaxID=13249 RepID=T1HVP6_RHOPR
MKFAEHLTAHITPEWRKQYITYEEMKGMLYMATEEAPSTESADPEEITRHYKNFDEMFFHYCDKELKKINTFYSEKLAEATRKFATLRSELSTTHDHHHGHARKKNTTKIADRMNQRQRVIPPRKLQELKLAFSEFYLSLILLQNYQNLNFTGFRKILKKHDKLLNVANGAQFREEKVESSHFYTNTDIVRMINEVENTVTEQLEGGDRQRAMKRLRVPPLGEKQTPWTTFKVGLFSGSFIVLFSAVILAAMFHNVNTSHLRTAFKLYRGPLLVIELLFLIGVNIYGWRSSGVNHVLIFELDPRNHLSEQDLMEVAATLGVAWTVSLLAFLFSSALSIPPFANPLALTLLMVMFLVNPVKIFRHQARFWLLRVIWRCIAAPFYHVGFADFWLADQFNSLVTVFMDFHFMLCFYLTSTSWMATDGAVMDECQGTTALITGALVNCIPAWMRFAQCLRRFRDSKEAFPHLVNAGKYSTTFFVVIFNSLKKYNKSYYQNEFDNPYLYMWLVSSLISTVYTSSWDIWMDWGLMDSNAGENRFLREEVVYSWKGFYYLAIAEDLLLRLSWLLSFLLSHNGFLESDLLTSLTAPLEVFRRFVWNFFRLENEHLNNCGKFRAVRDISVTPLDSSDHVQIIRMMDDEDGVLNRSTKKKPGSKRNVKEDRRPLIDKANSLDFCAINVSPMPII